MNSVCEELHRSVSRSVQEVTRRFAGIELTEGEAAPAEEVCTVHTVLEGACRTDLLLWADASLFDRLARSTLCSESVTGQDVADVATEYFNVICGRLAALLFREGHGAPRFQIPRFHSGRYQPDHGAARRWEIGYRGPGNESLHLVVCLGAPRGAPPEQARGTAHAISEINDAEQE